MLAAVLSLTTQAWALQSHAWRKAADGRFATSLTSQDQFVGKAAKLEGKLVNMPLFRSNSVRSRARVLMVTSRQLEEAHDDVLGLLRDRLALKDYNYAADFGVDKLSRGDVLCRTQGFEAPAAWGVSWCSALLVTLGDADSCSIDECLEGTHWLSDIVCWNAPVNDVPHLITSIAVSDSGIDLLIDFLPRAEGGYDMSVEDGDGEYPQPQSREEFVQASVRTDLGERYFTAEARDWRRYVLSAATARETAVPAWSGALHTSCRFGLDSLSTAVEARKAAVQRWVQWKNAASEVSQMKRTMTYRRDNEIRSAYKATDEKQKCRMFGYVLGQSIAEAHAGPEEMVSHSRLGQGSGGGVV